MLNQLSSADIRALNVFKCIAECGSFSSAQNLLNINESTISSQISGFENRIGYKLCTRGRAGFKLTERGRVVIDEYLKLDLSVDNFRQKLNALKDTTVGSLRVGILDHTMTEKGFSTVMLISRFIEQAPNVELHLVQDIQSKLLRAVIDEQLDVAIGAFDTRNELIKSKKLYTEHQYLYCGKNHPLFDKTAKRISLKDIEQCDWIARGYQLEPFIHIPVKGHKYSATAANIESVLVLILAGKHIGYMPAHFADKFEKEGKLRRLLPRKFSVKVDVSLISRSGKRQTLAMKLFSELCRKIK